MTGPVGVGNSVAAGESNPRIVALGGGHGLYATLSAARRLTHARHGGGDRRRRRRVLGPVALRARRGTSRRSSNGIGRVGIRQPARPAVGHHHPAPLRRQRRTGRASHRQPAAGRAERVACRSGGRARRTRSHPRCPWTGAADVPDRVADRSRCGRPRGRPADEPGDQRSGGGRHHARKGPAGAAAAGRPAGHPAGRRRHHGRRPGGARAGLVVHQRHPARAGARTGGRTANPPPPGGLWCSTWPPSRAKPPGSPPSGICTFWPSMLRTSRSTTSSSTPHGCRRTVSVTNFAGPRAYWKRQFNLLTSPDLVHLYMTRRNWPQRSKVCAYGDRSPRHQIFRLLHPCRSRTCDRGAG